jgi:hypothetical protein
MNQAPEGKANYRALMLREDAREVLDRALWKFEKENGYRPTYSTFVRLLLREYGEKQNGSGA